jgi:outer membrane protein OmpA-like peptidoglycan-associated protein
MTNAFRFTTLATALLLASGCSTAQLDELGKNYGTAILCGAGLVAGGAAGYAVNGKKGALIGAAAGTAVGCYAGSVWQSRMQALDRIAKEENLKIHSEQLQTASATPSAAPVDAGIVTQIEDSSMFDTGSDQLTVSGQRSIAKVAAAYANVDPKAANTRRLLVVGHTDATGSSATNQKLSERRARTVGKVLMAAGIPSTSIFYQGAGASRPLADNSTFEGRTENRRVEIAELTSQEMLVMRAKAEQSNAKYLAHGASTAKPVTKPVAPAVATNSASAISAPAPAAVTPVETASSKNSNGAKPAVDFGGVPTASKQWNLGQNITPKTGGFSFISTANASDIPVGSCQDDMPRESGEVMSLATDKPLDGVKTHDYLPGYNNRVWANTVNGNLVTISPVSILREGAEVGKQPFIQVVKGYGDGNRKPLPKMNAVANTYEGEKEVLYRVFISEPKAPVACMDVVFSKGNATAERGALFYPVGEQSYTVAYAPISTQ